jgi:hypothetical protein
MEHLTMGFGDDTMFAKVARTPRVVDWLPIDPMRAELFKQFSDNPEFKRWQADIVFSATNHRANPVAP